MNYYEAMKAIHAECRGDYKLLHDKGVKMEYISRRYKKEETRSHYYTEVVEL